MLFNRWQGSADTATTPSKNWTCSWLFYKIDSQPTRQNGLLCQSTTICVEANWGERSGISLRRKFTSLASPSNTTSNTTLRAVARTLKTRIQERCIAVSEGTNRREGEAGRVLTTRGYEGTGPESVNASQIPSGGQPNSGTSGGHASTSYPATDGSGNMPAFTHLYHQILQLAVEAQPEAENERQSGCNVSKRIVRQRGSENKN